MAGFRMSASAGSSGEESGRAALARVGFAGSFFECFAGSRSGRFAMTPIWVESGSVKSAAVLASGPEDNAQRTINDRARLRAAARPRTAAAGGQVQRLPEIQFYRRP